VHQADYLEIDDRLAYVELFGREGPTILCLHTAGQSGVQYRTVAPQLASLGYQVVIPDMPGHGRSEPHRYGPVLDLGLYACWALDVIDRLDLHDVVVLGVSIGAKIVLDMAARDVGVGRIKSVISIASGDAGGEIVRPVRPWEFEDANSPSRRDRTYFGTLAYVGRNVPADRAELIAQMHCREDHLISTTDAWAGTNHDIRDTIGTIRCPVYFVAGEEDFGLPPDRCKAAADMVPGSRFEVLAGYGHYAMEEMPDFAARVNAWIRELEGQTEGPNDPVHLRHDPYTPSAEEMARIGDALSGTEWIDDLRCWLDADEVFQRVCATFDGAIGIDIGGAEWQVRVYRGKVLELGRRTPHGPSFVVRGTREAWARLATAPLNDYVRRSTAGEFRAFGDSYEYLRMFSAVMRIIDAIRYVAGGAQP
jgi:pimeloyl-ACP methyl ester carboxylesterase